MWFAGLSCLLTKSCLTLRGVEFEDEAFVVVASGNKIYFDNTKDLKDLYNVSSVSQHFLWNVIIGITVIIK